MSKIFNLSTITASRRDKICGGYSGSYSYDMRQMSASRLLRMSKGISIEAAQLLTSRIVAFETRTDCIAPYEESRRAVPIPEQFTDEENATINGGTINFDLLHGYLSAKFNNHLFTDGWAAVCMECGKRFTIAEIAAEHRCDDVCCDECGEIITDASKVEKALKKRKRCILRDSMTIYDYHHRQLRSYPIFEREEKRENVIHLGAEIEIDGGARYDCFDDEDSAQLARCFKPRAGFPLVEFEHDSSIDGGVECIFAPTTFDGLWARRDEFTKFYKTALDLDGRFERANGLHFHLDRDFFGTGEDAGKAAVLIDLMVYKYFDFFAEISRREDGAMGYCKKKSGVNGLYGAFENVGCYDHCDAVNGGGSNTIEIRFFGGHIESGYEFLAAADIVQAIARWAKGASLAQAEKATPSALVKYLKKPENVKEFIAGMIAGRPRTTAGDAWVDEFKTALDARIEKDAEKGVK